MELKGFLFFISVLFLVSLLGFYWFIPFQETYFVPGDANTNFNANFSNQSQMQFYPNLRFVDSNISYYIENCSLNKKNEMETAFSIISEKTILDFYPLEINPEIIVTCQSTNKFDGDLFIAGEGGPINITSSGEYNIIYHGAILLIKDSKCQTPNIAIHELLHVLGFEHSSNSYNIMYPLSKCGQEIGEDIIGIINEIYSIPSFSDLTIQNASAFMSGRYLNANFTVKNIGIKSSEKSKVLIYADEKLVDEMEIEDLRAGAGIKITLQNAFVNRLNVNEIRFLVEYPLGELEKNNNEIILKVKS